MPGETVFIVGYSYSEPVQQIHQGKILQKLGMDILIEQNAGTPLPGASGSPVIDVNGFLIGILSSVTTDPGTGKNVAIAVSTEYAKDVLRHKGNFNAPKKDYGELILQTVLKRGARQAIRQYTALTNNAENYYVYNLRSADRNGLREVGEKLMDLKRYDDAVAILKFNVEINPYYYHDYNLLARALLLSGNKEAAIKEFRISTSLYNDQGENEAFKELEKLGVAK
jgi:tetratricopeptide (TPR) repeat protein